MVEGHLVPVYPDPSRCLDQGAPTCTNNIDFRWVTVLSLLAHIFVTERHRPRAGQVGFSVPAFSEIDVGEDNIEPLLATNMRGTFLRTRVSLHRRARFGFSECGLAQEGALLRDFHRVLVETAAHEHWDNVVSSIPEALERMQGFGTAPKLVLLPESSSDFEPPPGVLPLLIGLSHGTALVVAAPNLAGLHTRIGDHVGILAQRVNMTFVAVMP